MSKFISPLVFVCILFVELAFAQNSVIEAYRKIEKKLSVDKKYVNVYAVNFTPTSQELTKLSNIPRTVRADRISFENRSNVNYMVIILRENYELDSMTILMVKKIETKGGADNQSFVGEGTGGPTIDTTILLSFGELEDLYFDESPFYYTLYDAVADRILNEDPASMMGLQVSDKSNRSKGIVAKDNIDFLNYARALNFHRYPVAPTEAKKPSVRRRGSVADTAAGGAEYAIDASFSHVSFYHKSMDFGFSSVSAELNFGAKGLNMVPWQPMGLTIGIRSLFTVSQSAGQNLRNDFVIDAKLMGRMRINTSKFITSLPFVFGDRPNLNVGSGVVLDIAATRAYDLPFFNLYYSNGAADVSTPYVKFTDPTQSYAYFSFKQLEASFSFYWCSSEERTMRYRMEAGVGNYNVYRADYLTTGTQKTLVYNKVKPFIGLQINFAPQSVDFVGTGFRFYDNVIMFNFWLRLLELNASHIFRLETFYATAPILRSPYPWETAGGNSLVQIRYRFGL